eukprot:1315540-Prymnesium_polylepis.1
MAASPYRRTAGSGESTMVRWRWYWSPGRKSAEGRRQRGSLGLASRKAWQPSCAMHVRWVPYVTSLTVEEHGRAAHMAFGGPAERHVTA